MLMYDDGSIMGFREGLVVVGREDVRLVVVLTGSEAKIDD